MDVSTSFALCWLVAVVINRCANIQYEYLFVNNKKGMPYKKYSVQSLLRVKARNDEFTGFLTRHPRVDVDFDTITRSVEINIAWIALCSLDYVCSF